MILNHSEFHKVQLDENREMIDGKLIKSSVMIHIRCDQPDELIKLYKEVKTRLNGKEQGKETIEEENKKEENVPYCDCGLPMALRKNKKKNSWFWSCQKWNPNGGGCGMTKPYVSERQEEIPIINEES